MYECKAFSFKKDANDKLTTCKSGGVLIIIQQIQIPDASNLLPSLDNNGRIE